MTEKEKQVLAGFYREQLFERVMPFWMERAIDREHGGYFNCFDNRTGKLVSTDKFTWSQGRFAWLLSRLASGTLKSVPAGEREKYLALAGNGVDFIGQNCLMENGRCAFQLTRAGKMKEPEPGSGYDTSIYADMFAVMGLSEYARVSGNNEKLERALALYRNILARIESGEYRTWPYPVPQGYRSHGLPMIMLNTSQAMRDALEAAGHPSAPLAAGKCASFCRETLEFMAGNRMMEFLPLEGGEPDTLVGSYVNPGHCLEDAWFIAHQAARESVVPGIMEKLAGLAREMFRLGWDEEFGGIRLYVHRDGGRPRGRKIGGRAAVMEEKLETDWDYKLWWVHSEALYTFLLLHERTGDPGMKDLHDRVREYAFRVFPHPDEKVGEWIQVRDRRGDPANKVVALPVKDPFHLARNLVLLLELLGG